MTTRHTYKFSRFNRDRAQIYIDKLDHWLFDNWLGVNDRRFYGGSWVRGCQEIGDIDVAVYFDPLDRPMTKETVDLPKMFRNDWEVETLVGGAKLARHVVDFSSIFAAAPSSEYKFQLDLWFTDNLSQWGPLCMFVAGDAVFNIKMRQQAAKKGCMLSQYAILQSGESVGSFPTEASVFRFFDMPFVPYNLRNKK